MVQNTQTTMSLYKTSKYLFRLQKLKVTKVITCKYYQTRMHSSRMRTACTMAVGGRDWEKYILYEFCKNFDILKKKFF